MTRWGCATCTIHTTHREFSDEPALTVLDDGAFDFQDVEWVVVRDRKSDGGDERRDRKLVIELEKDRTSGRWDDQSL